MARSRRPFLVRMLGVFVRPNAFDPSDPRRQLRGEQAIVGRLDRQLPHPARVSVKETFQALNSFRNRLGRLKNEAGSWEYIRFLAEANAVYGVSNPDLLRLLPRPTENDYAIEKEEPQLAHPPAPGAEPIPAPVTVQPID